METLRIAGGGPAGLACGIRLLQLGRGAELHERKSYPLKKVCGEFLSPLGYRRLADLGADAELSLPPKPLAKARFYYSPSRHFDFALRPCAWGLSREAMDTALARRFERLGGRLVQNSALEDFDIDARGRPLHQGPARWMGWKGYLEPGQGPAELEPGAVLMLPVKGGYCGLSEVEDGRVSVCFVARAPGVPDEILRSHPLLESLAGRIRPHASIAGFAFSSQPAPGRIGDARRVWPPLVGDGMSRAMDAGIALAEGREPGGASQALQFALSKAAHSLMLSEAARALAGPLLGLLPGLPSLAYRFSRG